MTLFDPELLRTFIAVVDGGSLARASEIVGRSPSAVTAQMQRLQEAIGEPLLEPQGRGRSLTRAGQELVVHARRVLAAHREAWLAVKAAAHDGPLRLAATQDFTGSLLPDLLRTYARAAPRVTLELRIGRTGELTDQFERGEVDILLVMRQRPSADEIAVLRDDLIWLSSASGLAIPDKPLPLAVLDAPCNFRQTAVAALEASGTPYRIGATSASLEGLLTAVRAGLAVTLRTARALGAGLVEAPVALRLPPAGACEFSLRLRSGAGRAAADLGAVLSEGLQTAR